MERLGVLEGKGGGGRGRGWMGRIRDWVCIRRLKVMATQSRSEHIGMRM